MFALIKRELTDHLVHFLLAVTLAIAEIGIFAYFAYTEFAQISGAILPLGIIMLVGCCFMGIAQSYDDRANKISAFLVTLAVTRTQILMARCLTGVLAILIFLVPLVAAAVVVLPQFTPPLTFYWPVLVEVPLTLFLTAFTCYCFGLLIGTSTRKLLLVGGCLCVPLLLIALVIAKGFGLQAMAVLGLLILAILVRLTTKFSSTPL